MSGTPCSMLTYRTHALKNGRPVGGAGLAVIREENQADWLRHWSTPNEQGYTFRVELVAVHPPPAES